MQDLKIMFSDLFNDTRITNERLGTFTLDHLGKLTANNPGNVFNTIIADTQTKLTAFGAAYQLKGTNVGNQKGSTLTKLQTRKDFTAYIRQQEGTIRGKFGKSSEPYMQFFPNGLSAFNTATDSGYMDLVNNIIARATQYVADLGNDFKDAVTTLGEAYKTAEVTQTNEKGDVSNSRDAVTTERTDLTEQLTTNVLTIALQFIGQTDKESIYFNTSLLFPQHRKRIYKGTPAAGATVLVTKISYEAGKFVKMENKGAADLTFQMYLQGNPVGNSFSVLSGNTVEKKMSDFFSNADELKATNTGSVIGNYKVELVA